MSVELVNGHVLIPHVANYRDAPSWERRWQNEIDGSEFGNESRFGLRSIPLQSFRCKISSADLPQNSRLLGQIIAAKKSGLACLPAFGRGIEISNPVIAGETLIGVEPYSWIFSGTSYVLLMDENGNHDARQVISAFGGIEVDSPLSRGYRGGTFLWPLVFGKFYCDGIAAMNQEIGEITVGVYEIQSPYSASIGVADPPVDGIGGWIIEDTFIVQ